MSWHRRPTSDLPSSHPRHLTSRTNEGVETFRAGPTKTVRVRFQVEARVKGQLGLVGDIVELGGWDLSNPLLMDTRPGQFPTWTSREIVLFSHGDHLVVNYRYVFLEGRQQQAEAEARRLEVQLSFTNCLTIHVCDALQRLAVHRFDSREDIPLLHALTSEGGLLEHVKALNEYMATRGDDVTLQDLLALVHYFRYAQTDGESESRHLQQAMLKLAATVLRYRTEEVEPIIRDVMWHMAACCQPLRMQMQAITDRSAVESGRLGLRHAAEVSELLEHLFNDSSEEYMTRALTLNAVRSSLRKSTRVRSELALFYDIWLEETQLRYIEERFSLAGAPNLQAEVHKLTIMIEALELSSICAFELSTLRASLESTWQPHALSRDFLEGVKGVLIELLDILLRWLGHYASPEALQGEDPLSFKETLMAIGLKYVKVLLPVLWQALLYADRGMQVPHYVPLCKGTAIGKMMQVKSLAEIPATYTAVVAVLTQTHMGHSVPECVKGVLMVADQLDAKLLSYCHAHHIVLALLSTQLLPERLDLCVQVHVFDDCIEFL